MARKLRSTLQRVSLLHRSGLSDVYLAKREGKMLVAKVPREPSARRRKQLRREFELLKRFDSPRIVRVLDLVDQPLTSALLLEWDESLKPLNQFGPLTLEQWLRAAVNAAASLHEVHTEGLVHKDVKPENFLASEDFRRLVLLDFGHCRAVGSGHETADLKGSPAYVAPEQTGRLGWGVDARADLYSLGVSLFELMAGSRPFPGDDVLELAHAHIAKQPPRLTSPLFTVPPVVEAIVSRLLAKSPDARYQTACGLQTDIQCCIDTYNGHTITSFPLGQHDGRRTFHIPESLYGRRKETNALLDAYREASEGHRRVVFVTGDSGVGKSRLVGTVRGLAHGAAYLAGKADQFERRHPFSALISALGAWSDEISRAEDSCVERWRSRLRSAVGSNGQLVVDLIPKLAWLLGEQQPVARVGVEQSDARLLEVVGRLVTSLAAKGAPLVVFLDDLQWVDQATLAIIRRLATDGGQTPVLVLCSYRHQEVDRAHPISKLVRDVSDCEGISTMRLGPLSLEDVDEFVADALGGADCPELVDHVFERSAGNPFYLAQLLTSFRDAEVIRRNPDTGAWFWDESEARCLPPHDDVVDLLLTRLSRLPESCRETLAVAAVLGTRFDVATLATACGRGVSVVGEDLLPALEGGYIRPHSSSFDRAKERLLDPQAPSEFELGFAHDRIQEVAKGLLGPKEAELRGGLGLRLVGELPAEAIETRLFELIDHCNFLGGPSEAPRPEYLAELNFRAARRARDALALEIAVAYCGHGRRFLGPDAWNNHRELMFELTVMEARCEYLCSRPEVGSSLLEDARRHQLSRELQTRTLMIEGVAIYLSDDSEGALDKFSEALDCSGLSVPRRPSPVKVASELARTKWALRGRTFEQLSQLPVMTNPSVQQQIQILLHGLPAAYSCGAKGAFLLMTCVAVRLVLRYGRCPGSGTAFASLGLLFNIAFRDVANADLLGRVALDMATDTQDRSRVKLVYGGFIGCWSPISSATRVRILSEACEDATDCGDLEHVAYCWMHIAVEAFHSDPLLVRNREQCEAACNASQRAGMQHFVSIRGLRLRAACVAGEQPVPKVEELVPVEGTSAAAKFLHCLVGLDLGLLFDSRALSIYGLELAESGFEAIRGSCIEVAVTISACLAACRVDREDPWRRRSRRVARRALKEVGSWARICPENFSGIHDWLAGEYALSNGKPQAALKLLGRALEQEFEVPQRRGAILETMARAQRIVGNERQAMALISQACEAYRTWGASRKVDQLVALYASEALPLRAGVVRRGNAKSTTDSIVDSSLDIEAVFKSAQALSGEVVLHSLLQKMIRTVLESTGGQRAAVLEPVDDGWELSVWGEANTERIDTQLGPPDPGTIPLSVVASVSRMQEPVQISDAARHEVWSTDLAVKNQGIRSILCVPVVRQRRLDAIVYVDHLSVAHCFPASRARLLQMLASQISISLQNARLYATLENKVEQRTEALHALSEDLRTILDHVRFGFLVIGRELTVRPGFSRCCEVLLGSRDLAGRGVATALGATDSREAHAIEFCCQQIFEDVLPPELHQQQFPGRMLRGERVLRVEPSAVRHQNRVVAILLTVIDNTELEAAQRENNTNRVLLSLMRRKSAFLIFLRDCSSLLDEAVDAAHHNDRDHVARCLHTLKGAVGLFGLFELEEFIHALEGKSEVDASDVLSVRAALEAFLEEHRDLLGQGLSADYDPEVSVPRSSLDALDRLAARLGRAEALELRAWASYARSPSARDVVGPLVQAMTALASRLGKEVKILVQGGETRVESPGAQAVLRGLVLLFRNSLDHGIERPMDRGNKPRIARVRLEVSKTDNGYEFVVADDGRGIDVDRVTRSAVSSGSITESEAKTMTERERLQLIFNANLSTANTLSTVSGRGVGMAALKERVVKQGGEIEVDTQRGKGTTITIRLPKEDLTRLAA